MVELEDLPWFPRLLREYQGQYIGWLAVRSGVYEPLLAHWDKRSAFGHVRVDLCSGSGEPALSLHRSVGSLEQLTLTDRFPARGTTTPINIRYATDALDARSLRPVPGVIYTMFNAFHHFTREEQAKLVRRIKAAGAEGWFVEVLEPTLVCALKVLAATTIGVVLFMPFVRPFRWGRLFFTYLLPLNVFTITWDGLISVLRSRRARTYRRRFAGEGVRVMRFAGLMPLTVLHVPRS